MADGRAQLVQEKIGELIADVVRPENLAATTDVAVRITNTAGKSRLRNGIQRGRRGNIQK
jgi:hypothetical protein